MAKVRVITAQEAILKMNKYKELLANAEAALTKQRELNKQLREQLDAEHVNKKMFKAYKRIAFIQWITHYTEGEI